MDDLMYHSTQYWSFWRWSSSQSLDWAHSRSL